MKVVIAGSRNIKDYSLILRAILHSRFDITEVVCGCAIGVDRLGQQWAIINQIPVREMPAQWQKHGKSAGPIRNREMAQYADAAIVIWDGKSRGALNMIQQMNSLNKPCHIMVISDENTN